MVSGTVTTARAALEKRGLSNVAGSDFLLNGLVDDVGDEARADAPENGSSCLPAEWVIGFNFVGESYARPGSFFRLNNGIAIVRQGSGFAAAWVG